MRKNLIIFTLSLILLFAFSANSFAKQIEKDETKKTSTTKVVKKQTVQNTDVETKKNPTTSVAKIETAPIISTNQILKNTTPATTSSMAGEQINWQVISSGGNQGTSTNYNLTSVVGQTAVGLGSSTNYQLNAGFLQVFGPQGCCFVDRGNVDGGPDDGTFSGSVDISDLVFLVAFMFQGGATPVCTEEANIDGLGIIDISDLVGLVAFMFQGGAAPQPC